MELTKEIVEKWPLPEKGQSFLWDDRLKGFGVRFNPVGRTYVVQSRVGRKTRRVSIGKHGVLTLQEARKRAVKQLSGMLDGLDPVVEKAREEAFSLTLKQLAERYISDRRGLKQSSIDDINKHIKTNFSSWADRPAMEITRDRVAVLFRKLSERSPAQTNQAFRILRALLNYARAAYRPEGKPLLLENPVDILSDAKLWNRIQPRSGRIPTNKIGDAWNYIRAVRANPAEPTIGHTMADFLTFLLLTGARKSEASGLTWDRVNLEEKWWHLPDPKNRNPVTFPLSDVAVEILDARPGVKTGYVFPGRSKGAIRDGRGILNKCGEKIGVHVIIHDLRRTFRAIAGEVGIELWRTKLLMNHRLSGDVTINSYTETSDLRYFSSEINQIADWITRQGKNAAAENVVLFPRKAVVKGDGE